INEETHILEGDSTFVITGAIKAPKTKITTEEIQNNANVKAISNLDNLQAVNEKLASIKITGVDSLAATAIDGSATDVTVTITINEETHTLVGANTFRIEQAIKDDFVDQRTIYKNFQLEERTTFAKNLAEVEDIYQIVKIGFFKNDKGEVQVPRMPHNIGIMSEELKLPSEVTSLESMFEGYTGDFSGLTAIIANWDVSNITNMSHMFHGAEEFNGDISMWDVSKVTNMSYMFAGAKYFDRDISKWDVSNVTDISYMFAGATIFNQNLSNWTFSNNVNHENFDHLTEGWKIENKPKFI
ncbi:BspA family leucine-rich repeat surface protein, partial [Mesoplasma seiffertii]|uniref:BspA family leucine-rich repeat surface protein n=1 Tax=Mesoplasma seiffertii TaxID=28224 RepID=UPI0006855333